MAESLKIEVLNDREALATASAEAEGWLETHEASPKAIYLAMLVIEELVTNCIEYGYDDKEEHTILIELGMSDGRLTMTVVDDGHEFDPLQAEAPDTNAALDERPIGGLGIHMLRKMSDSMEYQRVDGTNRITIAKQY